MLRRGLDTGNPATNGSYFHYCPPLGQEGDGTWSWERQVLVKIRCSRKRLTFLQSNLLERNLGTVIAASCNNHLWLRHWLTSRRKQMKLPLNCEVLQLIPRWITIKQFPFRHLTNSLNYHASWQAFINEKVTFSQLQNEVGRQLSMNLTGFINDTGTVIISDLLYLIQLFVKKRILCVCVRETYC